MGLEITEMVKFILVGIALKYILLYKLYGHCEHFSPIRKSL